jgi:hypothetical protein
MISDWVLEHVEDSAFCVAGEEDSALKPVGFC